MEGRNDGFFKGRSLVWDEMCIPATSHHDCADFLKFALGRVLELVVVGGRIGWIVVAAAS